MNEEKHVRDDAANYHRVMGLMRSLQMEHGLCQPRARRACTQCNARDDLEQMLREYKGQRLTISR